MHVLFHPNHPLAQRLGSSPGESIIPAKELRQYPVVDPVLTQLSRLARELNPGNSHHVGALPAVFRTICQDEAAVGLFPGGPWPDLAQLLRPGCIRHAKLQPPGEEGVEAKNKYKMHLRVIMPEGGEAKLSAEACEILKAVRRTLKNPRLQPTLASARSTTEKGL